MIARTWTQLIATSAALWIAVAAGAAAAQCPAEAPTGVFKGATAGTGAQRTEVMLNLACDDGRYVAQFFTSAADFASTEAVVTPGHIRLTLDARARGGTADLTLAGDTLTGRLQAGAASGDVTLVRSGRPLALDALRPTLALSKAQWREDLAAFAAELPKRHANAFFYLPKARFEAEIASLDRRLGQLNDDEIFVGIERLTNAIGDGHTYLTLPRDRRSLPIEIARFGAGPKAELRVVAAGPGYEQALGAKVVRIGATPVAEAWRRVLTLTPQQELPALQEGRAASYLASGLLLHGLGIIPDREHAVFTLRDDTGRAFTLDVAGLAPGASVALKPMATGKGVAQENPKAAFWCRELADQHAVYCGFRAYDNLGRGRNEMLALIEKAHPGKLIIDMRDNGGGDNTLGYAFVIKPLEAMPQINQKGRLYVLVGALTFSAAMNNAAQFQDETQAILVGQQIGEKPNSYQEPRQFRLPNSHLIVRASSLYYKFRAKGPNAVTPDKTIVPTWDDVKAGRDPVLDWVLAQPTP
jgi:hypothetical protein